MRIEKNKDYCFDKDQYLWRYLDLHRLIYFLNTENLFFSPLNTFFDPLEGISEEHVANNTFAKAINARHEDNDNVETQADDQKPEKEQIRDTLEIVQKTFFASCWYVGVRESLAMWDSYSNKDSVAIRFDPQNLCSTVINTAQQQQFRDFDLLMHGRVDYSNMVNAGPEDNNLDHIDHNKRGFLKDISYCHEQEFRFLVIQKNAEVTYDFFELPLGNLKPLQFTIVTHPSMEPWKYTNICNVLKSRGLGDKITRSKIPTRRQVFDMP